MGRSNGANKPSAAAVVSEIQAKKPFDDPRDQADFQATNERLLAKEIAKVVQPNKRLDKSNNYQYLDVKLDQLLQGHRLGEGEVPDWLAKLYENLQFDQDQLKVKTNSFLKRLTEEIIAPDQYPPDTLGDVARLLDSLKLINFNADSKYIRSRRIQILQEKLDESLGKLKSFLTDRPEGWIERYTNEVAIVKNIIGEFEGFLQEMEGTLLTEPVFDLKTKALVMFAIEAKKNLEHFRQSLKQWDNLAKVIVDKTPKNDDIIVVKHKKSDSPEITGSKDEL